MTSAGIQRWAILLGTYHCTVQFKPGPCIANADAFSRLPLAVMPEEVLTPPEVIHLTEWSEITSQICAQIAQDPTL